MQNLLTVFLKINAKEQIGKGSQWSLWETAGWTYVPPYNIQPPNVVYCVETPTSEKEYLARG